MKDLLLPLIFSLVVSCLLTVHIHAQTPTPEQGVIDLEKDFEEQIASIEERLYGDPDMDPSRQAVLRLWLIELYDSTSRFEEARLQFDFILSLSPYDVGIMNRYASFLMERMGEAAKAESLLSSAVQYGELHGTESLERGTTLFLLGRLRTKQGRKEDALEALRQAAYYFEENPRQRAKSLWAMAEVHRSRGELKEALELMLESLATSAACSSDELETIETIASLLRPDDEVDARELVISSIERAKRKRRNELEETGAELVMIRSRDGFELEGTLYRATDTLGVLFVSEPGRYRYSLRPFLQLLSAEGITTMSVDLRGSGASVAPLGADERQSKLHRRVEDVASAVEFFFEEAGLLSMPVVMAEGAAFPVVEKALHRFSLRCPVVSLSPILDPTDRELMTAISFRPDEPLLVLYSKEDRAAVLALGYLSDLKPTLEVERLSLVNAGHGRRLLRHSPEALARLLRWIGSIRRTSR